MVLLTEQQRERDVVLRLCDRAYAAGIRAGMPLADARALLPPRDAKRLLVAAHDARRDAEALQALAEWAVRYTPVVAPDTWPPDRCDALLLDVTGCERVHHGLSALLQRMARELHGLQLHARIAAAPTFGAAWALAHFSEESITVANTDDMRDRLASLPTQALRIDESIVRGLDEIGVTCVGELFDLPRGELPSRFGDELLLRLDQMRGQAFESIDAVRPAAPLDVQRLFAGPVKQLEAIQLAAKQLLQEAALRLLHRESAARQFHLTLYRSDIDPLTLSVQLSRPSRDAKHLWSLFAPKVEKAQLGFGVDSMRLDVKRLTRIRHAQQSHWRNDAADRKQFESDFGQLLDVLTHRFDDRCVLRMTPHETHQPGDVTAFTAAAHVATSGKQPDMSFTSADRPTFLLPKPEPIEVLATFPEGPPRWLRWRGVERRIRIALGPERIADQWFAFHRSWQARATGVSSSLSPHDYFKLQDEHGQWLWIFSEGDPRRWFIYGQWS